MRPRRVLVGAVAAGAALAGAFALVPGAADRLPSATTEGESTPTPPSPTPTVTFACRPLMAPSSAPEPGGDLALTGARVVTMKGRDRAIGVTIHAGRIVGVGRAPAGAIDLDGATLIPGLIDSHSHWIGDKYVDDHNAVEAIDAALAEGWTSITEMFVDDGRLNELCSLARNGDLRLKVGAFLPLNYQHQRFGRVYEAYRPGQVLSDHLVLQGVKLFADGAEDGMGRQTEAPSTAVQGALFWKPDELAAELLAADRAGWQVAVHATGDAGLDAVLDAFETVGREAITSSRHRVEHVSTVRDDQVQRLADLGLIASVQHSWYSGDVVPDLVRWLGPDRARFSGRWRDLLDAGVPLAGGSDHPWTIAGEYADAIRSIAQAVTRVGPGGAEPPGWMRAQRLSVWEVLRSLTVDAAYARGAEDEVGTIEPGKAGDLVVLSADPTRVAPSEIASIEVLATVVDGRVEHCGDTVPRDLAPLCPSG